MKIAVVGAGAMGSIFGARFAEPEKGERDPRAGNEALGRPNTGYSPPNTAC